MTSGTFGLEKSEVLCALFTSFWQHLTLSSVLNSAVHNRNVVDFWYIKAFDYEFFLNRVLFNSDHRHLLLQEVPLLHISKFCQRFAGVNREDACSRTGGIFIRDTALDTAYSLWFNELWPNQGQTMRNHTPYHTAYTTVWRMILGRMHALKCKKISCKSLQKSIEAMIMKEKRLPQITLSLFD